MWAGWKHHRWRRRQLEHKLAVGARYVESGLVFTWLDGSPGGG